MTDITDNTFWLFVSHLGVLVSGFFIGAYIGVKVSFEYKDEKEKDKQSKE